MMEFASTISGHEAEVVHLFEQTFSASEGQQEGAVIGTFVRDLIQTTPADGLTAVLALEAGKTIGAAMFSRVVFQGDSRSVFILSPMAVAPDHQKQGKGQALINKGLDHLIGMGVDVALTYGDPAYYTRCGFLHVTAANVPPPLPLSHPEGWLAQSLDGADLRPFSGPSRCVSALDQPGLW